MTTCNTRNHVFKQQFWCVLLTCFIAMFLTCVSAHLSWAVLSMFALLPSIYLICIVWNFINWESPELFCTCWPFLHCPVWFSLVLFCHLLYCTELLCAEVHWTEIDCPILLYFHDALLQNTKLHWAVVSCQTYSTVQSCIVRDVV